MMKKFIFLALNGINLYLFKSVFIDSKTLMVKQELLFIYIHIYYFFILKYKTQIKYNCIHLFID